MGRLHDKLKAVGYEGHALEVYLVRLLFCLFGEDTSIFERRQFQDLIEQSTAEDGRDLAQWLANLFEVLDTPPDKRLKSLDEQLAAFPYVNGNLYAERLRTASFDRDMRDMLLECCALGLEPDFSGHIRGAVSIRHGSETKAQSRGALHGRKKHLSSSFARCFWMNCGLNSSG